MTQDKISKKGKEYGKKFLFSVVEEAILNEDFLKKYPNYSASRIEIWHKDESYDIEEIRFCLPYEIMNKIGEAIDLKEVDYFKIGNVCSSDLEKYLKARKEKKITIRDFVAIIPWEQIKEILGKKEYKRFCKWIGGQTTVREGVYPWDLERFLDGKESND